MGRVSASEFERQVFEVDEVRIVTRCRRDQQLPEYPYERKAATTTSLTEWLNTRIKPLVGDVEVDVIDGTGVAPHGRTNIENVRNGYVKK